MRDPVEFDPVHGGVDTVAPGVRRILAPNPSPMTFRGTNTYVVGQGAVGVIDPGPDDPDHLAAILHALNGEIVTHILVTHAHLDHSPLARPLAAQTGAPILAFGDARAGRSSVMADLSQQGLTGGGEGVDHDFCPDLTLADGAVVNGANWSLTALHTPGHMANHLCFVMGDVVFSGDLVMGWSTSLVSPPDGDLGAFLTSCARLQTVPCRVMLPGHGAPVTAPQDRIAALIAHRNGRTTQILSAVDSTPRDVPEITKVVYADLPDHLLSAAQRNVFAHLIDLSLQNQVVAEPKLAWSASFKRPKLF